ncbi:hypothetical protein ACIP1Z_09500, partial [Pseudomonas moraviensis]|uniref:hypothetical protein n=1 Tax=Pseudomonas moraviensis TaxID=321662 RepID=UPI00381FB13C
FSLFDMFAVGFKHSYYPHQWSQMGVRDARREMLVLMRCAALWAAWPELPSIPYRSCFQSFTPAERGADEGWRRAFTRWKNPSPTPL